MFLPVGFYAGVGRRLHSQALDFRFAQNRAFKSMENFFIF